MLLCCPAVMYCYSGQRRHLQPMCFDDDICHDMAMYTSSKQSWLFCGQKSFVPSDNYSSQHLQVMMPQPDFAGPCID